jgi:cytoskeletal protein RodZ
MWPFNRNQSNNSSAPDMPPELNDYYQAEKRQQTATTLMLGFATLLAGAILIFGVFVGVKWFISKVQNNPKDADITVQQDQSATPETPSVNNDRKTSEDSVSKESAENEVALNSEVVESGRTSSATTSLPNTGPTETLMIFASASVLGAFAHRLATKNN